MRLFISLLCALSFFAFSGVARAYYDDSVVIEIGDVLPQQSTTSSTSDNPQGGVGGGAAGSSGNPGTATNAGGSNAGGSGGTVSNTNSSGAGGTPSLATPPPEHTSTANQLFDVLTAGGAITGQSAGGVGSGEGSSGGSPSTNGSGGSGAGTSGGSGGSSGTVTINAAKVRETLRGKLSFQQVLEDFAANAKSRRRGTLSGNDISLMAASTVLEDANIQEVSFGATRFDIVYRSEGYLIGFIPKSFPVRVSVNPRAVTIEGQVQIALPWYRFFLRRLFDNTSLARDISAIIAEKGVAQEGESATDVQARLFDAISSMLSKKIGTVGSSIRQE